MARKQHCLKGYSSAQAALARLKEHGCVYFCTQEKCGQWHTNHKKLHNWNEGYRGHIAGYAHDHQKKLPQKDHCAVCHS